MERRHFLKSAAAASLVAVNPIANAQTIKEPQPSPAGSAPEKVFGIGGVFFRSKNPDTLGLWYQEHLGIPMMPTKLDSPVWNTDAGVTVFAPFKETTHYFDISKQMMLNFRVRDLAKMAAQLTSAGIEVKVDPEEYPNGRFAHLHDPEGNPIELWQPK
jgi:glyoxylase I family protein